MRNPPHPLPAFPRITRVVRKGAALPDALSGRRTGGATANTPARNICSGGGKAAPRPPRRGAIPTLVSHSPLGSGGKKVLVDTEPKAQCPPANRTPLPAIRGGGRGRGENARQ